MCEKSSLFYSIYLLVSTSKTRDPRILLPRAQDRDGVQQFLPVPREPQSDAGGLDEDWNSPDDSPALSLTNPSLTNPSPQCLSTARSLTAHTLIPVVQCAAQANVIHLRDRGGCAFGLSSTRERDGARLWLNERPTGWA